MKKIISMAMMALLLATAAAGADMSGSGGKEKVMAEAGQTQGPDAPMPMPEPGMPGHPAQKADGQEMGMMGMGQAMMPNMMNMMMARSPLAARGEKMMRMPMMNPAIMPMGMGGMGAMPMMMSGSSDETAATLEKFRNFLKETKSARKELNDLCFAYFEASWTPETTVKELQDMSLKMRKLRDEIMAKMPK